MSSPQPLPKRPPGYRKTGRVTWVEKTADLLGVNRIFLRRPPVHILARENQIISPAHAKVETLAPIGPSGEIEEKSVLRKKRRVFLGDLLKSEKMVHRFLGGEFIKLYLAPWDLHFLLFPVGGKVTEYHYSPGKAVPLVIMKSGDVKNERLCICIETEHGFPLVFVMVGSWMVSGIHHAFEPGKSYRRGEDLGYFAVGSSVVMAFPPNRVDWLVREGDKVRIGSPLARLLD